MKVLSIIALIIAVVALAIGGYTQFVQINKLEKEKEEIAEDILRLEQEVAKSYESKQAQIKEPQFPRYHDATGVLKSISGDRIVVDEDEIPGFMRAMVMSYEVENPRQLEGLKEGDKVKLKLKETENDLTVVEIQKQ
jgi:Cu/Ag efflux protein CusF